MTTYQCHKLIAEGHQHVHCPPYDWKATILVTGLLIIPLTLLVMFWLISELRAYGESS